MSVYTCLHCDTFGWVRDLVLLVARINDKKRGLLFIPNRKIDATDHPAPIQSSQCFSNCELQTANCELQTVNCELVLDVRGDCPGDNEWAVIRADRGAKRSRSHDYFRVMHHMINGNLQQLRPTRVPSGLPAPAR